MHPEHLRQRDCEAQQVVLSQFCQIKWERAKDLRRQGKLAEAERELLEALDEAPDHSLLKSSLANLYVRKGKLLEAKVLVEEIQAKDPQCLEALVVQGEIAFKEKNFTEALRSFGHALQKESGPYLTLRMARTLREMERYSEALEILDTSLVAHREEPRLLKEKALILNRMRRWDEAVELYEKLRFLVPEDRFVQKEILRLKGLCRSDREVIKELQTAVSIRARKDDAQLHGLLAQKLKDAGQVQEAAVEYRTASQLEPYNPYFMKQQGFCHYSLGEYDNALECLGQAFQKDPSDIYVKGTLKRIYTTLGRLEEFLAMLEEVYQAHPHNVKLLGTIKKLKKLLNV
ncbi:MAG: tetratricopeptide repeat protein [Deltaproteobacteria bacterium]|nr:MAG: tetratricopeptide repeat protein [Deltaproteobacteria bacterium]